MAAGHHVLRGPRPPNSTFDDAMAHVNLSRPVRRCRPQIQAVNAMAQVPGRTYHLGCLLPATHDTPRYGAFFDELRRRGFIEGHNLTVEFRAYAQHVDLIPQYAAELVKARVDVIATTGDETVRAVQQATKTIPIVGDMLGAGLVNSLSRPDGQYNGRQYPRARG
jgi:ABC transporter substrate binding protein